MAYDSKHVELLSSEEGYNLSAEQYKKQRSHLDSFYSLDFNRLVPRERKDYCVLDLGAGDGRMYPQLSKIKPDQYIACDIAKSLLSKHPGRIKKVVCDLEQTWPFEDQSFDLLTAFFLLEHLQNLAHFFAQADRILRPWGQILIGHFLQRKLFSWTVKGRNFKIEQYDHDLSEIQELAEYQGFKVGVMELYDTCDENNLTGYLIVCEKK